MRSIIFLQILFLCITEVCVSQQSGFYKLTESEKANYKNLEFTNDGALICLSDNYLEKRRKDGLVVEKRIKASAKDIVEVDNVGKFILMAHTNGKLTKLSLSDLSVLNEKALTRQQLTAVTSFEKFILVGSKKGELICLTQDLTVVWRINLRNGRINNILGVKDALIVSMGKDLFTVSLSNGKPYGISKGHSDLIRTVSTNPDHTFVVSSGNDKQIILWRLKPDYTLEKVYSLNEAHQDWIYHIKFDIDGKNVITSSFDRDINIFKFLEDEERLELYESVDVGSTIFKYLSQFDIDPTSYRLVVGTFGDGLYASDIFQSTSSILHDYSELTINKQLIDEAFDSLEITQSNLQFSLIFDKPRVIEGVKASLNGKKISVDYDASSGKLRITDAPLDIGTNSLSLYIKDRHSVIPDSEYSFQFIIRK